VEQHERTGMRVLTKTRTCRRMLRGKLYYKEGRMPTYDKPMVDRLFADLRSRYGNDPDWELILRDAHLGVARHDAGVDMGQIDPRAKEAILKHGGP